MFKSYCFVAMALCYSYTIVTHKQMCCGLVWSMSSFLQFSNLPFIVQWVTRSKMQPTYLWIPRRPFECNFPHYRRSLFIRTLSKLYIVMEKYTPLQNRQYSWIELNIWPCFPESRAFCFIYVLSLSWTKGKVIHFEHLLNIDNIRRLSQV